MVRCSRHAREIVMEGIVLSKFNVFEAVTKKIVAMIETAPLSYKAPWHAPAGQCLLPTNATTCTEYRGVNVLSLWIDAQLKGYVSPVWASFLQWQKLGAQVRRRERGTLVVFYKRVETEAFEKQDHDSLPKLHFVARASHVFNVAQVDGYTPVEPEPIAPFQRLQEVEAFVATVKAEVRHGFSCARYRRDADAIEMPNREWFVESATGSSEENYYAVLLHELTHWVGAPHRLNREFGKRFGDSAYAFEELVAELGAAFLCAAFGISTEPRPDHAAYVGTWLEVLNRDPKAIFTAARKAQEAFEHLAYLATQPQAV
jgi:antirestriction protein ArdC